MKEEKGYWEVFAKSAWASGGIDRWGNLKRFGEGATVFESKDGAEEAKQAFFDTLEGGEWDFWTLTVREI